MSLFNILVISNMTVKLSWQRVFSVTNELRKKSIYYRVKWVQIKLTELLLSQDSCERRILLHF